MKLEIVQEIREFVEELKKRENTDLVFNPFKQRHSCINLIAYLSYAKYNGADILLMGEAPGFGGARHSGVSFTSGHLLWKSRIYSPIRNHLSFLKIKYKKELSASIVYSFFHNYPEIFKRVILWNAFPFHPHEEGEVNTNRTPNKAEINEGQYYIMRLLSLFSIKSIYAIGNQAFTSLKILKNFKKIPENLLVEFKIRHPARGGAKKFISNLKEIFSIKDKYKQMTF